MADARAEAKGELDALLLDSGCWLCLAGGTVLLRYSDAALGSLE